MERCDQCGNAYAQTFHVVKEGKDYAFDCFECAIEKLAPRCDSCGTRIVGHGMESGSYFFCCAHCARMKGVTELIDHEPLTN